MMDNYVRTKFHYLLREKEIYQKEFSDTDMDTNIKTSSYQPDFKFSFFFLLYFYQKNFIFYHNYLEKLRVSIFFYFFHKSEIIANFGLKSGFYFYSQNIIINKNKKKKL